MRNPPLDVIATWPKTNYINPETQGNSIHIVCITMIALSVILVSMRIYVRWRILHNMGTDDWLILLSLIPAIGLTTSTLMGTRYGWGYHIWDTLSDWSSKSLMISWISQFLFVIAAVVSKLSICWSYRRLSDSTLFSRILTASKIFIMVWGISFTCTTVFKCWPVHAYWSDLESRGQLCINENVPLMTASITNIGTDFWITLLPIPILWRLRLPFRQRMILILLMSLGLVAGAAGIARVYYLDQTLFRTYDITWEGYHIWLWTAVEIDLGIICCSIPPLRPLIRRHFPRMLETNESFGLATALPGEDRELPDRDDPERAGRIVSTVLSSPRKTNFTFNNGESGEFYPVERKLPLMTEDREQPPSGASLVKNEASPLYSPAPTSMRSMSANGGRFSPPPMASIRTHSPRSPRSPHSSSGSFGAAMGGLTKTSTVNTTTPLNEPHSPYSPGPLSHQRSPSYGASRTPSYSMPLRRETSRDSVPATPSYFSDSLRNGGGMGDRPTPGYISGGMSPVYIPPSQSRTSPGYSPGFTRPRRDEM